MSDARLNRRTWLARMGAVAVGTSGVLLNWGRHGRIGLVTPLAAQTGVSFHRADFGHVNAWLVVRGRQAALIDTGYPTDFQGINSVVQAAGLTWADVRHVIFTHTHFDHIGGLLPVMSRATRATTYIHDREVPDFNFFRPPNQIRDGNDVFGLTVVETPGHTSGHISLLDNETSTLIVGDAATYQDNVMGEAPDYTTLDRRMSRDTIRKIGTMSFERALFMHGEPLETGAAEAFRLFGETLPGAE